MNEWRVCKHAATLESCKAWKHLLWSLFGDENLGDGKGGSVGKWKLPWPPERGKKGYCVETRIRAIAVGWSFVVDLDRMQSCLIRRGQGEQTHTKSSLWLIKATEVYGSQ